MSSFRPGAVSVELTEPQRRHLRVFLDQVEAAVAEVVRLTDQHPAHRTLTIDEVDVPAGFDARVRPEFERLQRGVETLTARFGLEPERRSRLRRIQALLIAAAVEIEDAGSRALQGYGPVARDLSEQLDPVLDDIGHALDAMLSALFASAPPSARRPAPDAPS